MGERQKMEETGYRDGKYGDGKDRLFLEGMWQKVEEKERNEHLAEVVMGEFTEEKAARAQTGQSMAAFLGDMFQGIGFRQVYAGMADVLGIAFGITLTAIYLLMQSTEKLGISVDIMVFSASPILYACMFLLFWMKDVQSGSYGLQMSYKYTFFHVLAARMLASSLLGMCFNGLYLLVLFLRYEVDLLRLGAVSFSSLACFSVLLMLGIERGRQFGWSVAVCVAWVMVNLTALLRFPQIYGELLGRIPVYLLLIVGAVGMWLYLRQLWYMTTLIFRKEYSDVAN